MWNIAENVRGILEPALGIGVAKIHDVVGYQQKIFNFPQTDGVVSQSVQKVKPPYTDNVMHKDVVILREGPDADIHTR